MRRAFVLAAILIGAVVGPVQAWWQYAQWGLSPSQIVAASSGQAVPCRPDAPVCAKPAGGLQPNLFVERLTMVGMLASAAFAFDANDKLVQTAVLFPDAEPALIAKLVDGIHGEPAVGGSQPLWQDDQRGTILTVTGVDRGTVLLYRPAAGR